MPWEPGINIGSDPDEHVITHVLLLEPYLVAATWNVLLPVSAGPELENSQVEKESIPP